MPVTPNLGLILPAVHDQNWGVPTLNAAFTAIDTWSATVVVDDPAASQTVSQPGGTYFNFNFPNVFSGANPSLRFGTAPDLWDSALTRQAPGSFTLDTNVPANAAATLRLSVLNALTGLQVASAAPLNHILVGDGSHYVDSASLPAGFVFYQTVQANGTPRTQRPTLNFLPRLTAVDDSGNTSTDVDLATTAVTPGSYTLPNFTVDAYGRLTAAANGSLNRVDNSNGSYIRFPDGTLFQWGKAPGIAGGGTETVTFPTAFTTTTGLTVMTSAINGNGNCVTQAEAITTTQFTAGIAGVVFVGGSGTSPSGSESITWTAFGH